MKKTLEQIKSENGPVKPWMARTRLILEDEQIETLANAHVLVVGLGGVGAICAEMIARAGVGKMTIVDADVVEATNRNRQLVALTSTEGVLKSTVLAQRLLDINPELILNELPIYFHHKDRENVLDREQFTYAVDCIDTLSPKVHFIKSCMERGIPLVSSMGAGGKVDPTLVRVADISQTYQCHLARYVRKKLHSKGIYRGVKAVFSPEVADQEKVIPTPQEEKKKSVIGTISYIPAVFGCVCASVAIRDIVGMPIPLYDQEKEGRIL